MIEEIVFLPAVVVRRSLRKAVFLDDALCLFIGQHTFEFFRDLAVHLDGAQSRVGSAVDDAVRMLQLLIEEQQADQQDEKKACQKRFPVTQFVEFHFIQTHGYLLLPVYLMQYR